MNEQDKKFAETVANIFRILPADKQEYLLGVMDGMAIMATEHTEPAPAQ